MRSLPLPRSCCGLALAMHLLGVPALAQVGGAAHEGTPALAGTPPILVMPFDDEGRDPRLYWIQEGAAVMLADIFNAHGAPALTRTERVRAFERLLLPPVASLSHATVIKVGQAVGASEVVLGRLDLSRDELMVRARLLRLDTGQIRPEVSERGKLVDLVPLFERVARALKPELGSRRDDAAIPEVPLEAFENYIKGLLAENPDTQVKFLETAIAQAPAYHRARLALWDVHSEQSEHARALAVVEKVAEDSPQRRRAKYLASVSLIALGRHDEAFDILTQLQEEAPSPAISNNMGIVQLRRGWTDHTGRPTYYFNEAVERDPSDETFFFNLGYAYWVEKDPPAAIYWLREAVRRDPADADAHFVLGAALQASGGGIEAVREKELARQLSSRYDEWQRRPAPTGEAVPKGLERVARDLETPRAARVEAAIIAPVQREQEATARFHLDSGRRLLNDENHQAAIHELRRAIFLSPYISEGHLLLGRAYLRLGRVRDAIDAFKISLWSEETAAGHAALAEAYLVNDERTSAEAAARRALILDATNAEARALLERLGGKP